MVGGKQRERIIQRKSGKNNQLARIAAFGGL
jgi:hypothetical protein